MQIDHILKEFKRQIAELYGERLKKVILYGSWARDEATIDLCLTLFPWAKFRKHKAAVKIHTLMDFKGSIPTFIRITDGKVHDVNISIS